MNMNFEQEYQKMRPYKDNEVPAAIKRILKEDSFNYVISYLYGEENKDKVLEHFKKIKTVTKFQSAFSHYAVREVVRKTSGGLTYSGLNKLDTNKAYLFIANHRDIVLDSAIMQILLVENNHKTSQITFGSNLMTSEFIIDLGKLNKMFTFYRGGSKIQMYRNALLHSKYIKKVITEENESIWIAQKDGRTKDGNDKTQTSLIKMLTMGKENPFTALKELNIIPVVISYEYEPCDTEKIQEKYISKTSVYKKQAEEDFENILKGIKNHKGRIHMHFGKPVTPIIDKCEKNNVGINELTNTIALEIDRQIYESYKLRPVNYIALDLLNNNSEYFNKVYNEQELNNFIEYVEHKISTIKGEKTEIKKIFLNLYANPVINNIKSKSLSLKSELTKRN